MAVGKVTFNFYIGIVLLTMTTTTVYANDIPNMQYFGNVAIQFQKLTEKFGPMNGTADLASLLNLPEMSSLTDIAIMAIERYQSLPDEAKLDVSPGCLNDMELFLAGLINTEDWALRMLDAAGKPPSGLLNGNIQWLGSYDECLAVQAVVYGDPVTKTDPQSYPYTGQYCRVSVPLPGATNRVDVFTGAVHLTIGVCVPNSCSAADIQSLATVGMYALPVNSTTLSKLGVACQKEDIPFDDRAIASIIVFSILASVMVLATLYDVLVVQRRATQPTKAKDVKTDKSELSSIAVVSGEYSGEGHVTDVPKTQEQNSGSSQHDDIGKNVETQKAVQSLPEQPIQLTTLEKVLLSFSVYTNGAKILNTSQPAGTLSAVNGIRFLSMSWIIVSHVVSYAPSGADNRKSATETYFHRFTFQTISNSTLSVDTFFVMSGVLVAYLTLRAFKKAKTLRHFNWLMFYFHRYWRLTPPMMLIIVLYVPLEPYWNNGPLWPQESEECRDTWWRNMLYINNLFSDMKYCMMITWYLAIDMQLYVISPLLLIPLYRSKILGGVVCLLAILGCVVSRALLSFQNNLPENRAMTFDAAAHNAEASTRIYMRPWNRMSVYVVGLFTGYLLYRTKCKVRLSKLQTAIGWVMAVGLALAVLYGIYNPDGDNQTSSLSKTAATVYNATSRTAWGVAVAWVIFACATGNGGFVNTLLSWKAFVPLARLTYMAYLIQIPVLTFFYKSRQALIHVDDLELIYVVLGHLCVIYAAAFVLSLALEAPMMGLEKALLGRGKHS